MTGFMFPKEHPMYEAARKLSRHEALFPLRYEDDLLLVTKSICEEDLPQIASTVYLVDFEMEASGKEVLWTDLILISRSSGKIIIKPKQGSPKSY